MAQVEPKLFRIRRRASTGGMWKYASAALAVAALGAGAFGYMQYDTTRTLRGQLAAATAKANQVGAEDVALGSQLSAAQDRVNSQATKLSATKQQASLEQQELDEAQRQATAEQRLLAAAQRQVEEEKYQLRDAQVQLAAESRPDLPVRVLFLDAARVGAKVVVLQNLSKGELDVTIDVQSPGTNAHIRKELVLAAGSALRLGPAQGWSFTAGQVVTLDNAKFRHIVQTVT